MTKQHLVLMTKFSLESQQSNMHTLRYVSSLNNKST